MPSHAEIREVVDQGTVGFETEGHIVHADGRVVAIGESLVSALQHACGKQYVSFEDRAFDVNFRFVYGTVEVKTRPHLDVSASIASLLGVQNLAARVIHDYHPQAALSFDANAAKTHIGLCRSYEIGTQLHIDLKNVIIAFFAHLMTHENLLRDPQYVRIAMMIAYLMQQDAPTAIQQFCHSPRIAAILQSGDNPRKPIQPLPLQARRHQPKFGTTVYRPNYGTIECCTPDSTLDPVVLMAMVEYCRGRVVAAVGYLLENPAFALPGPRERFHERLALIDWVAKNHRVG